MLSNEFTCGYDTCFHPEPEPIGANLEIRAGVPFVGTLCLWVSPLLAQEMGVHLVLC